MVASLPEWWEGDFYRKDVLLFTVKDLTEMKKIINSLELKDEILHLVNLIVYWVRSMINQLITKQLIIRCY